MDKLIEINYLKNLINKSDKIALAVSGGSDSMAMLYWFLHNKEIAIDFFVVNFEHGIRGESSKRDSEFVKNFCKKNNIECVSICFDTPNFAKENSLTLEQAGRVLRYKYFDEILESKKATKIALAHHKLDQVETILMRIFRGTGLNGLKGILENRENKFIRPLLNTEKSDIMDFIKTNKIQYVEDETNNETEYTRNYIRNELLPNIRKQFPNVDNSILKLSEIAKENEEFVSKYVPEIFELERDVFFIYCKDLIEKVPATKAILKCFSKLGVNYDVEKKHIDLIFDLQKKQNGAKLNMPYGVTIFKEYDKLVFLKTKKELEFLPVKLDLPFSKKLINKQITISKVLENEFIDYKKGLYFDFDKLPKDLVLRKKKNNDQFIKFGGFKKSLSDFLTDKKIPLRKRADLIVGASRNMVYFIIDVEISDLIKIDSFSKNIYKITSEDIK